MDKRPNVVFVLTDNQGYGNLGCHGNSIIKPLNIDKFHRESTQLTNYHVGPTCALIRAGLMTGHIMLTVQVCGIQSVVGHFLERTSGPYLMPFQKIDIELEYLGNGI